MYKGPDKATFPFEKAPTKDISKHQPYNKYRAYDAQLTLAGQNCQVFMRGSLVITLKVVLKTAALLFVL